MKIRFLFLAFILILAISFSAQAKQGKPTVIISRTAKAIAIDGDLEEHLDFKPSIKMNDESYEKLGYNPWDGMEDLSADIYLLWDDENLYVVAKVTDDVPFVNNQEGSDIWNGDCLEIMLGTDEKADPERTFFVKGDYQIGLSPGNNKDIKPSDWIWRKDDYTGGIEVVSKPYEGGYVIESKIPFKVLDGFKPQSGRAIGFNVAVDEADKDAREIQFVWFGTKNFYMDPSEWGVAVFSDQRLTSGVTESKKISGIPIFIVPTIIILGLIVIVGFMIKKRRG